MDFSNGNGKNNDWGEFLLKKKSLTDAVRLDIANF